MKKLLVSVAALSLIAGCSDKGADHDGDGKITAEEVAEEMNRVTLEPGEWENTVKIVDVKVEGLPEGTPADMMDSMKGKVTSSKSCITREEAENPGAQFFAAQEKTSCEVTKFNMSGGAVSSEMSCSNMGGAPGDVTVTMDGQYGPSSYEMTTETNGGAAGMTVKFSSTISGKRIGDCPAG